MSEDIKFQSLYFDPSAPEADRVVLHDPLLDDLVSGIIALKSLKLEDRDGIVVAGTAPFLTLFRKKLEALNPKSLSALVQALKALINPLNLKVAYGQGSLLDLKRQVASVAEASYRGKPSVSNQPRAVSDFGKEAWETIMKSYQPLFEKLNLPRDKWDSALTMLGDYSHSRKRSAYSLDVLPSRKHLLEDFCDRDVRAKSVLAHDLQMCSRAGLVSRGPGSHGLLVRPRSDGYEVEYLKRTKLSAKAAFHELVEQLRSKAGYAVVRGVRPFLEKSLENVRLLVHQESEVNITFSCTHFWPLDDVRVVLGDGHTLKGVECVFRAWEKTSKKDSFKL